MWPALIGAAASVGGGILNSINAGSARDAQEANINAQMAMQREFATTGLQWRAGDAMKAYEATGIHPLALLGVNTPSYTPVSASFEPDRSIGNALSDAGQGVSRALMASASEETRRKAMEPLMNLQLQRMEKENTILDLRIASEEARLLQQSAPGIPTGPGVSNGTISFPGVEKKIIDDVTVARTPRGGYVVLPGKEAQERMEEIFGLGPEWFARNRAWLVTEQARQWVKRFLPAPPNYHEWRYHPPTGEWLPSPIDYPDRHLPNLHVARGVQRYLGLEAPNYLTR